MSHRATSRACDTPQQQWDDSPAERRQKRECAVPMGVMNDTCSELCRNPSVNPDVTFGVGSHVSIRVVVTSQFLPQMS